MYQLLSRGAKAGVTSALLAVTLIVVWRMPVSLWLPTLLLSWALLALSLVDIRSLLLPDKLTLSLLWLGLLVSTSGWLPGMTAEQAVYGAAAGYGALWLLSRGYRLLRSREGLGLGDAKLLAALGAWMGVERLPWIVLAASLIAAASLFIAWLTVGHALDTPFPFGPALSFAGWALFLWLYG